MTDLADLSRAQRVVEEGIWPELRTRLSEAELAALVWDWRFWQRPSQTPPGGDWSVWVYRGGRGAGKTRTGSEWVRDNVDRGLASRVALVAPTVGDVRDVIIEGESGLMTVWPDHQRPQYIPSRRKVVFHNGAVGHTYSAEKPDRLRGPQHDLAWFDEAASAQYLSATLDNLLFGLRLGSTPRLLVTTTPKPLRVLRELVADATTVETASTTWANAHNLSAAFLSLVLGRYGGTRLGAQELEGEWLDGVEGALWTEATIDAHRRRERPQSLDRTHAGIVEVGVDPPGETAAECGIIVAMAPRSRAVGSECWVLADASVRGRPEEWGRAVVDAYHRHRAECVVVEANQGGDMCRAVIHAVDSTVVVRKVRASESKKSRAEPVAALYEQGRVHHVGLLAHVEAQMVSWTPDDKISPDRMDALVHVVTDLLLSGGAATASRATGPRIPRVSAPRVGAGRRIA